MTKYFPTILALTLMYCLFLLLTFGWGFIIGAGLTWMGILSTPTYCVVFFLVLNHIALILSILNGRHR